MLNKANQTHSSLHTHLTQAKRDDRDTQQQPVMSVSALTVKRSGRIALAPTYFRQINSDAFLVLSTEPMPGFHSRSTSQKAPAATQRTSDTSPGLMMLSYQHSRRGTEILIFAHRTSTNRSTFPFSAESPHLK